MEPVPATTLFTVILLFWDECGFLITGFACQMPVIIPYRGALYAAAWLDVAGAYLCMENSGSGTLNRPSANPYAKPQKHQITVNHINLLAENSFIGYSI